MTLWEMPVTIVMRQTWWQMVWLTLYVIIELWIVIISLKWMTAEIWKLILCLLYSGVYFFFSSKGFRDTEDLMIWSKHDLADATIPSLVLPGPAIVVTCIRQKCCLHCWCEPLQISPPLLGHFARRHFTENESIVALIDESGRLEHSPDGWER